MTTPPQLSNSDQLFITRKRKKWKFAHFDTWPNCFAANQVTPGFWPSYFTQQGPLVAEIGAGTGDMSVGLAQRNPDTNFVAVDVKADRLYTGAKTAMEQDLTNLAFVRAHADHLQDVFAGVALDCLWVTFPDPFPRDRQAKHRLLHPTFLDIYGRVLAPAGVLRFKTDNRQLFLWSLEQLVAAGWQLRQLSFDLHQSTLPVESKITTQYERRFLAEGQPINYVEATAPSKPAS